MAREDAVELSVRKGQRNGIAIDQSRAGNASRGDLEHPGALVERDDLAAQVAREEARAACDVQDASRRQCPHRVDHLLDLVVPAGAVARGVHARAEPPVVVLGRAEVVVRTHLLVHHALRHGRHATRQARQDLGMAEGWERRAAEWLAGGQLTLACDRVGARDSYAAGTFCWVDHVSSDAAAAKRFYGELLGWEWPAGDGYVHFSLGGQDVAGVYELAGAAARWTSYAAVADADAAAARAVELGGVVVEAPFDVGDDGRRVVVADPVGAHVALWQARAQAGAELVNDLGCWCSNQLVAPEPEPAFAFYRELFGWEIEAAGEGYWSVHNAGADNGGILASPAPPSWLVYFHVEDADASARSAEAAGASVLFAPETIGLGRIAVLADPQGAAFGLFAGATDP